MSCLWQVHNSYVHVQKKSVTKGFCKYAVIFISDRCFQEEVEEELESLKDKLKDFKNIERICLDMTEHIKVSMNK